jgi:hypothetical protein
VEEGAAGLVPWNALAPLEAAFWDTGALNALEDASWSLRAHAVDGLSPVVVMAAVDCLWMARVAINKLVRALRVRLHLLAAAGRDWNMENFYGNVCPVVEIMDQIDGCVCTCAEITGNDDLDCLDFLGDVTDPVALAEAIRASASVNHITVKSNMFWSLGGERGGSFGRVSSDVGCVQLSTTLECWCNLVGARSVYGKVRYPRDGQKLLRMKHFDDLEGSS